MHITPWCLTTSCVCDGCGDTIDVRKAVELVNGGVCISAWFHLIAASSIDAIRNTHGREFRLDFSDGLNNRGPDFSGFFGRLTAQSLPADGNEGLRVDADGMVYQSALWEFVPVDSGAVCPLSSHPMLDADLMSDEMYTDPVRDLMHPDGQLQQPDGAVLCLEDLPLPCT